MTRVQFFLYRHGATEANLRREYLGRRDLPLAKEGREELEGKVVPEIDLLFSSPLLRCLQTAEILFPGREYETLPEWMERDFGPYEGKRWAELKDDPEYRLWIESEGEHAPGGMERTEDFRVRIRQGFRRIERSVLIPLFNDKDDIRIAVIAHGGTILEFMRLLYPERPYYEKMPGHGECSRFHFRIEGERFLLMEEEDV